MANAEFFTIIAFLVTILIIMLAGFGCLIHQTNAIREELHKLDKRLTVIETILSIFGYTNKKVD